MGKEDWPLCRAPREPSGLPQPSARTFSNRPPPFLHVFFSFSPRPPPRSPRSSNSPRARQSSSETGRGAAMLGDRIQGALPSRAGGGPLRWARPALSKQPLAVNSQTILGKNLPGRFIYSLLSGRPEGNPAAARNVPAGSTCPCLGTPDPPLRDLHGRRPREAPRRSWPRRRLRRLLLLPPSPRVRERAKPGSKMARRSRGGGRLLGEP